jgi:hypothetical protein
MIVEVNVMINSRQIVELIREELKKNNEPNVACALQRIVDKIEVLEDLELSKMYKDYIQDRDLEQKTKLEILVQQFEDVFK